MHAVDEPAARSPAYRANRDPEVASARRVDPVASSAEPVATVRPPNGVAPRTTAQHVAWLVELLRGPDQLVVPRPRVQMVTSVEAIESIVAPPRKQHIVAEAAVEIVGARSPSQAIVTAAADSVLNALQLVVFAVLAGLTTRKVDPHGSLPAVVYGAVGAGAPTSRSEATGCGSSGGS